MGWFKRTRAAKRASFAFGLGFIFASLVRYNKQYVLLRMTPEEAKELLDALDIWIEGYQDTSEVAGDDEVLGLYDAFVTATDLRTRLWKEVTK